MAYFDERERADLYTPEFRHALGANRTAPTVVAVPYLVTVWPYRSIRDADASAATRGWDRFLWLNQIAGFLVTLLLIWWWLLVR